MWLRTPDHARPSIFCELDFSSILSGEVVLIQVSGYTHSGGYLQTFSTVGATHVAGDTFKLTLIECISQNQLIYSLVRRLSNMQIGDGFYIVFIIYLSINFWFGGPYLMMLKSRITPGCALGNHMKDLWLSPCQLHSRHVLPHLFFCHRIFFLICGYLT